MNELPNVDIVITTIGRPSLSVAIEAALSQTYQGARCVVVADGQRDCTDAIVARYKDRVKYVETPKPLRRAGNGAKEFWYNSDECAPFFRYLDDDDWMPNCSIMEQMKLMKDGVVLSVCKMRMLITNPEGVVRERSLSGKMKVGQIGNGSVVVRKAAVKGILYEYIPYSDFYWIKAIAERGELVRSPYHLYWYNQEDKHGVLR